MECIYEVCKDVIVNNCLSLVFWMTWNGLKVGILIFINNKKYLA